MGKPNKKLAKLRMENHLSQKELAQLVGVSQQLVQCWENGHTELKNASYANVMNLAEVLGVPAEELVPQKEWQNK